MKVSFNSPLPPSTHTVDLGSSVSGTKRQLKVSEVPAAGAAQRSACPARSRPQSDSPAGGAALIPSTVKLLTDGRTEVHSRSVTSRETLAITHF